MVDAEALTWTSLVNDNASHIVEELTVHVCNVCSKPITSGRKMRSRKYCSKECAKIGQDQAMKEWRLAHKRVYVPVEKKEKPKKKVEVPKNSISEVNKMARDVGMPYGKYILNIRLGNIKETN